MNLNNPIITANKIFREIVKARIYDLVERTPIEKAEKLSHRYNNNIFMKREDLQPVFSFKIRGAYNLIKQLSEIEKKKGVICVSAGNHGQGVALSAKKFGIPAVVVMPITTPPIKIEAVKRYGAETILIGDSYSEAEHYCLGLAQERSLTFIHPFDNPLVIAGQGTIGKELLEDAQEIDMVFVPIGGGGLISGLACYLKELLPHVKIVGVEPEESDGMIQSIKADERIILPQTGTFADGVSVKQVGSLTFQLTRHLVDEFITVSNDEICSAIENIYDETRAILEPAGALGIAGLKKYLGEHPELKSQHLIAINSGANMNFQRLQFVAERTLMGEKREALLAVKLQEQQGSLYAFCQKILADNAITEFNYRYKDSNKAIILLGIENQSPFEKEHLCRLLSEESYEYIDLTGNEIAKEHVRHMVGGSTGSQVENERIFRFQFPDRPRALMDFLVDLGCRWNISLFHHRSHGTDFNRVLIGLQVPAADNRAFTDFLNKVKYTYTEESDNIAYKLFL